jgi:hypothetical protein
MMRLQNTDIRIFTIVLSAAGTSHTVSKDSENFVTNNYGIGRLFSVTKLYVIDSGRPAAIVISIEIHHTVRKGQGNSVNMPLPYMNIHGKISVYLG